MKQGIIIAVMGLALWTGTASAGFPDSVHGVLFLGQSNEEGYCGQHPTDTPCQITTPAPLSPSGMMRAIGPRIFPAGGGAFTPLNPATLGPLVSAYEMGNPGYSPQWPLGDTSLTAFTHIMAEHGYAMIGAVIGQANTPYAGMANGTELYKNILAYVTFEAAQNPGYWVDVIVSEEGETDCLQKTPQATIQQSEIQWRDDLTADIEAITKQTRAPLWFEQQTTSCSAEHNSEMADLGAYGAGDGIRIFAPLYNLSFADVWHLDPAGKFHAGELAARAAAGELGLTPPAFPSLAVSSATEYGNEVVLRYVMPGASSLPLHWLSGAATHPANRGFAYFDCNGAGVPITNVVASTYWVKLTLAAVPACIGRLDYLISDETVTDAGQGIVVDSNPAISELDQVALPDAALATQTPVTPGVLSDTPVTKLSK